MILRLSSAWSPPPSVGYLVGLIALRRTGIYFAMITVAIAEVFFFVEFNPLSEWTGGENGLPGVPTPSFILGFTTLAFNTGWSLYPFLAFCYFVGIVIALRIVRSPVGAILRAIRDNPLRAAAVGHNVHGYKLTAFVDRRRLCRLRRRAARRDAGLHAARRLHVRHLGPARHADRDRRRRHAVRPAGRRRASGSSCRTSCRPRCTSARPGSWCSAWSSCCWSASCAAASSAASRTSIGSRPAGARPPSRRRERPMPVTTVQQAAAPVARSRRAMPPRRRDTDRSTGPILQATRPDQALRRPRRQQRHRLHRQARRAARHHRPERRRQDHLLQDADLRGAADLGHDRVRGPRHHRHERRPTSASSA